MKEGNEMKESLSKEGKKEKANRRGEVKEEK